jgi:hypothetical protein
VYIKLDSKPIDDIEFQEDNEEVFVFSDFCENQSFEFACLGTLRSETIHDQLQEENVQGVVFIDSSENQNGIHEDPLVTNENYDLKFQEINKTVYDTFQFEREEDNEEIVVFFDSFVNQDCCSLESNEEGPLDIHQTHIIFLSFEYIQEHTKSYLAIDDEKYEQMAPLHFENELKMDEIEHKPTFSHNGYSCPFVDFQDPFESILQSLEKMILTDSFTILLKS